MYLNTQTQYYNKLHVGSLPDGSDGLIPLKQIII